MGSELCHICDLFRTALFGPTDGSNEDHLDDGQGNGLPRPMADAPATMGVRPRNRPGSALTVAKEGTALSAPAEAKPASQHSGGSGATATPSVASESAATRGSAGETAATRAAAPAAAATASPAAGTRGAGSALAPAPKAAAVVEPAAVPKAAAPAVSAAPAVAAKPTPKTKFSKRAARGLKAAPAYMSFDDVDVEDDDSDGELFVDDSHNRRGSGSRSRSPGTIAAQASADAAYTANAPSVYRDPTLAPPAVSAPAPPSSKAAADGPPGRGQGQQQTYPSRSAEGGEEVGTERPGQGGGAAVYENMSSHVAIAGDSSAEAFASGTGGLKGGLAGGLRLGDRMASIPRDGSMLDSARPHGQSESFHGYKGYPGYEPDTPVAQQLTQPGHPNETDSLTINPGADVSDPRNKHARAAAPTPSSARYPSRGTASSDLVPGPSASHQDDGLGTSMDGTYSEQRDQYRQEALYPSGTNSMEMSAADMHAPDPKSRTRRVEVTSRQQRDSNTAGDVVHGVPSGGVPYGSGQVDSGSAYSGAGAGNHGVPSPSHSQANSMASSFRNIHHVTSEDGMGSALGTLAGTEDAANEDLQWKRSALKKFHKVMVKGEGLRVVKHNRSGGSQMRIIRYDPEIKALVWNSKRYMKKAGAANVPIIGIKRVGREGNTVSVTAAGRGTIGFEPQRIRDAKILEEALRALVDKEERSAMWRG